MTDESWRDGFKRAMIDVVVRHGHPVRKDPSFYGWEEHAVRYNYDTGKSIYASKDHVALAGIDYAATEMPQESVWDEFMGTFYQGDTRVYGVDVEVVCLDGQRFRWRWKGTVGELIQLILMGDNS